MSLETLEKYKPMTSPGFGRFVVQLSDTSQILRGPSRHFSQSTMTTQHRKVYIPLESNPDVFTELIGKLGAEAQLSVQDIYSLDDPDMIAMVPRPVYALIFNLISTEKYKKWRDADEESRPVYNGFGESEEVIWFEQTIHNACGFYGLLHAISNGPAADHICEHRR
jgi:ubiquitin carboxyl-terminal hydrolase L3